MDIRFTDQEINEMLQEEKELPPNYESVFKWKVKRGHKEKELSITARSGRAYRLILRQNKINVLDFSVILAVTPHNSNQTFRLRRYNGKSHEHTNQLEKERFYDFHIHEATERYQETGADEDAFARATNRFTTIDQALICLFKDCSIQYDDDRQLTLPLEGF